MNKKYKFVKCIWIIKLYQILFDDYIVIFDYNIFQWIFWHKISIDLKLIKIYKNINKTLKNKIKSIIDILKLFFWINWYIYIYILYVLIKNINLISVHWLLNYIKYYLMIILWYVIIICLILKFI